MMMRHLAAVTAMFAAVSAGAETINVPAGGDIQKAINSSSDGDIIQLEAGLYEPDQTLNTMGLAITIIGSTDKSGAPTSILDGRSITSLLRVDSGEGSETIFENIQIQNADGRGMLVNGTSPTLNNCFFVDNNDAGGMGTFNGNPVLNNCVFMDNSGSAGGGGFYLFTGSAILTDCDFSNNSTTQSGGAMYVNGNVTLRNCTFTENISNNSDSAGGGAIYASGSMELNNCTFTGNSTSRFNCNGGAMYVDGSMTMNECLFTENSTRIREEGDDTVVQGGGGAIFVLDSSPVIYDCVFSFNSAENGGAIFIDGGNPSVIDTVIYNNLANELFGGLGGGIYTVIGPEELGPSISGTTLCGNLPTQLYGPYVNGSGNDFTFECDFCEDSDGDGYCDEDDECPEDPNKFEPGLCGCGSPETDSDGDGTPDCIDDCPNDPLKTDPGLCGCGVVDTVTYGDIDCDGDFDIDDYIAMGFAFDLIDYITVGDAIGVCRGDLNGDTKVDGADLTMLLGAWGVCP